MAATGIVTPPKAAPTVESSQLTGDAPVIFFDGVCGLCNTFVDVVLRWDRRGVFRFAPLQGETAARMLRPEDTAQLDSVALQVNGQTYRKSSAVVRMLWRLGWAGGLAGTALWLVPKPIREWGYDFVAGNRYRWFGKKETCRLPTPSERERFLP